MPTWLKMSLRQYLSPLFIKTPIYHQKRRSWDGFTAILVSQPLKQFEPNKGEEAAKKSFIPWNPRSQPQTEQQTWESIAPHLDHCLQELNEKDRETLLLRFFRQRNLKDVGSEFGISADAAQKRVSRALDKL